MIVYIHVNRSVMNVYDINLIAYFLFSTHRDLDLRNENAYCLTIC